MPRSAAECRGVPRSAAECHGVPLSATECRRVRLSAAECGCVRLLIVYVRTSCSQNLMTFADKTTARAAAIAAGVPVVPGT